MKGLVKKGADINIKDKYGVSDTLITACRSVYSYGNVFPSTQGKSSACTVSVYTKYATQNMIWATGKKINKIT